MIKEEAEVKLRKDFAQQMKFSFANEVETKHIWS